MTATDAMTALDALVAAQQQPNRYIAAKTLYEAALAGLMAAPLDPRLLYRWVIKWAMLPGTQGTRISGA
jgi:hypothetical protein